MSRLPPPTRCTTFPIFLSRILRLLHLTSIRGGVVCTSTWTYESNNNLAYIIWLYTALVLGGEDLQALTLKLRVAPCRRQGRGERRTVRALIELAPSARGSWAPASQSIGSPRPEGTLVLLRAAVRACVCLTVLAGLFVAPVGTCWGCLVARRLQGAVDDTCVCCCIGAGPRHWSVGWSGRAAVVTGAVELKGPEWRIWS